MMGWFCRLFGRMRSAECEQLTDGAATLFACIVQSCTLMANEAFSSAICAGRPVLDVLRTDLVSLNCHVWETYHESFPCLQISLMLMAMNKR